MLLIELWVVSCCAVLCDMSNLQILPLLDQSWEGDLIAASESVHSLGLDGGRTEEAVTEAHTPLHQEDLWHFHQNMNNSTNWGFIINIFINIQPTGSFAVTRVFSVKDPGTEKIHSLYSLLDAQIICFVFHLLSGVFIITERRYKTSTRLCQEPNLLTLNLMTRSAHSSSSHLLRVSERRAPVRLVKGTPCVSTINCCEGRLWRCVLLMPFSVNCVQALIPEPKRKDQKSQSQPENSSSAFMWSRGNWSKLM